MKIIKLTTYRVPPRWMLLKIETDEGVVGWGEPVIEGRARTVETAVQEMEPFLIGQDPARINDLWQTMYRAGFYRGGAILMSAIAGIDQALWDIKGKVLGVPVYELLGGLVRDRMKMYSWVGGDRPADVIEQIRTLQKGGFDTFKMNGTEELGMLDTAAAVDKAVARVAKSAKRSATRSSSGSTSTAASPRRWPRPCCASWSRIARCSSKSRCWPSRPNTIRAWPIHVDPAGGRRTHVLALRIQERVRAGGLSIVQPDLSHAGGITECLKIASMAEAYDIALAPHCPLGPVALAACLQVDFVSYNAVLQEQSMGIHYNKGAELLDYVSTRTTSRSSTAEASRNAPDWRNGRVVI
jgi:galactonate dehydratase